MNRIAALGTLLTCLMLMVSCGAPITTPETTTPPNIATPPPASSSSLNVLIKKTITLGVGSPAELVVVDSPTRSASAQVVSAPAGLTVTAGTAVLLSTGDISIPINVAGTAGLGSSVVISISSGSKTSKVTLPVISFDTKEIKLSGVSSEYTGAKIKFTSKNTALISAPISATHEERTNLLQFNLENESFSLLGFGITRKGESITSQASSSDGSTVVAVRGMSAQGGYIIKRDPDGNLSTYYPEAKSDTLNNLELIDNTLWMTQSVLSAVKSLSLTSGKISSQEVANQTDSLTAGSDGNIYYNSVYTSPTIFQYSPATGQVKSWALTNTRSNPKNLTYSGGKVWFIDVLHGSVWSIDTTSGTQEKLALPSDACPAEIVTGSNGKIWVLDSTNNVVYYRASTGDAVIGFGTAPSPSALSVSPSGKVWYTTKGLLVREK